MLRDFSGGRAEHESQRDSSAADPLIAVLGSFQDGIATRLQAGQALQRVLLTATATGLSASFISQMVEVPSARAELRALVGGGL